MNFSLVYLASRFFYRIFNFVSDWYLGSFSRIGRYTINLLEQMDKVFALKVTLENLFQPLYGYHDAIGHTLGFIFRLIRIFIAVIIYPVVIALALSIYVIWAAIPILIIYRGFF